MMFLMPDAAPGILQGLCGLFDLYACSVFHGFVAQHHREALLKAGATSRETAPAPEQHGEFSTLRQHLEKALSGIITYLRSTASNSLTSSQRSTTSDGNISESNARDTHSTFVKEAVPLGSVLLPVQLVEDSSVNDLFALNHRVVAVESLWFAACVLAEVRPKLVCLLPETYQASCDEYCATYQAVASQLRALVYLYHVSCTDQTVQCAASPRR